MTTKSKALVKAGGRREGSGRPAVLAKQLEEGRALAKRLHVQLHTGLDSLGEKYPNLMVLAIEVAEGKYDNGQPNVRMLTTLIELLPRLLGAEDDGDSESPIRALTRRLAASVTNIQINVGKETTTARVVDADVQGRAEDARSPLGT